MKTNNLKFREYRTSENGEQYKIEIRLNDECGNGHQDFTITGMIWEKGMPLKDQFMCGGGAIGEEIAKNFPEYTIFYKLHLSDYKGIPMYAVENGYYHLKNSPMQVVLDYLRVDEDEYKTLYKCYDKLNFCITLGGLGIVKRWENEANEAIKLLEKLTGDEFIVDSIKTNL